MLKTIALFVTLFCGWQFVNGKEAANILEMDIRLCPLDGVATFLYRAKNSSSESVEVDLFHQRGNSLGVVFLIDPERKVHWSSLSVLPVPGKKPQMVVIPPGKVHKWRREEGMKWVLRRQGYELFTWRVRVGESPRDRLFFQSGYVCLGRPAPDGNIALAVVDPRDPTAKPILAFIYHEAKPHELGFLLLNGTGEDVTLEKPLTKASRIVASAPAIEYTRELVLPGAAVERVVVEPGKVGEWRLPWRTVYELLPPADVEKIKAAGGDLDLVWKVGEHESAPLPLSLAEPADATVDKNEEDDDLDGE